MEISRKITGEEMIPSSGISSRTRGDYHHRVSHNAKAVIKGFGYLSIQFPKFTYIRAEGFLGRPYRLLDTQMIKSSC